MIKRRIAWLGIAVAGTGVLLSLALRLWMPSSRLDFQFAADPAVIVLLIAFLFSALLLGVSVMLRRQQTHIQKALSELHQSLEGERRRFIRRLDHEMKNPLTAIQVQLDNLQSDDKRNLPAVEDVRKQVGRLIALTRGLRRLADLETRVLEIEQIDVEELLNEVVDLLQASPRVELDLQRLPWAIPPIDGDRELLLVAFRNLVHNGLNYSQDKIQVRARHTAGHLVVDVIDTGRGISSQDLPMVTEELYRGANVHDTPGSGLGLSLVKIIVERHGGWLELRSRPGQGTIATVHIAYAQP